MTNRGKLVLIEEITMDDFALGLEKTRKLFDLSVAASIRLFKDLKGGDESL